MTHIYDWIDNPTTTTNETIKSIKKWFDRFCCPAYKKLSDNPRDIWLKSRLLTCEYNNELYRCVGCSSLGDIWLTKDFQQPITYQIRVNIDDCSDWKISIIGELEDNYLLKYRNKNKFLKKMQRNL